MKVKSNAREVGEMSVMSLTSTQCKLRGLVWDEISVSTTSFRLLVPSDWEVRARYSKPRDISPQTYLQIEKSAHRKGESRSEKGCGIYTVASLLERSMDDWGCFQRLFIIVQQLDSFRVRILKKCKFSSLTPIQIDRIGQCVK